MYAFVRVSLLRALPKLFSIPKRRFFFGNVIRTLEISTQKRLGTVKTRFYIVEVLQVSTTLIFRAKQKCMLVCRLVCSELCPRLTPRPLKVCAAPPHLPHKLQQLLLQLHQLRLEFLPPCNAATLTRRSTATACLLPLSEAQSQRRGGVSYWLAAQSQILVLAMAHIWDRLTMMMTVIGSRGRHTTSVPAVITSRSVPYRIPAGLKP